MNRGSFYLAMSSDSVTEIFKSILRQVFEV